MPYTSTGGSSYRKVPCRHFLAGECRFGNRCTFLHQRGAEGSQAESAHADRGRSSHRGGYVSYGRGTGYSNGFARRGRGGGRRTHDDDTSSTESSSYESLSETDSEVTTSSEATHAADPAAIRGALLAAAHAHADASDAVASALGDQNVAAVKYPKLRTLLDGYLDRYLAEDVVPKVTAAFEAIPTIQTALMAPERTVSAGAMLSPAAALAYSAGPAIRADAATSAVKAEVSLCVVSMLDLDKELFEARPAMILTAAAFLNWSAGHWADERQVPQLKSLHRRISSAAEAVRVIMGGGKPKAAAEETSTSARPDDRHHAAAKPGGYKAALTEGRAPKPDHRGDAARVTGPTVRLPASLHGKASGRTAIVVGSGPAASSTVATLRIMGSNIAATVPPIGTEPADAVAANPSVKIFAITDIPYEDNRSGTSAAGTITALTPIIDGARAAQAAGALVIIVGVAPSPLLKALRVVWRQSRTGPSSIYSRRTANWDFPADELAAAANEAVDRRSSTNSWLWNVPRNNALIIGTQGQREPLVHSAWFRQVAVIGTSNPGVAGFTLFARMLVVGLQSIDQYGTITSRRRFGDDGSDASGDEEGDEESIDEEETDYSGSSGGVRVVAGGEPEQKPALAQSLSLAAASHTN